MKLEYSSGTLGAAATVYRMYLYDISITKGKLSDAKGLYYSNSTDSGFADCVLESSKAVIKESTQNKLLFWLYFPNIRNEAEIISNREMNLCIKLL